jgi:hypothetical protein
MKTSLLKVGEVCVDARDDLGSNPVSQLIDQRPEHVHGHAIECVAAGGSRG